MPTTRSAVMSATYYIMVLQLVYTTHQCCHTNELLLFEYDLFTQAGLEKGKSISISLKGGLI